MFRILKLELKVKSVIRAAAFATEFILAAIYTEVLFEIMFIAGFASLLYLALASGEALADTLF